METKRAGGHIVEGVRVGPPRAQRNQSGKGHCRWGHRVKADGGDMEAGAWEGRKWWKGVQEG